MTTSSRLNRPRVRRAIASGGNGLNDELTSLKTAVDRYFRLEYLLFRSSEGMTQEALDATVQMFHESRRLCMRLAGVPETD